MKIIYNFQSLFEKNPNNKMKRLINTQAKKNNMILNLNAVEILLRNLFINFIFFLQSVLNLRFITYQKSLIFEHKKILLRLFTYIILLTSVMSVSFAQTSTLANETISFNIEEGFGSVIFDQKNTLQVGVGTPSKETMWYPLSKYESWSIAPKLGKNINFLINDYVALTPQTSFSLEFEYQPSSNIGIVSVFNKLGVYGFTLDNTLQTGTFTYYTGLIPHVVPINNITYGQMNELYFTWNTTHYQLYSGNVSQILGQGNADILPLDININGLNLFTNTYIDLIDSFKLWDKGFNQTEINNLHNVSTIIPPTTNETTLETTINGTQQFDIINTFSPTNGTILPNPVTIQATLNTQATCEVYINNNFVKTNVDVLAFTNIVNDLTPGNHTYFLYCTKIDSNNILLFEITNQTNIIVQDKLPSQIQFVFSSNDFTINSLPMFMVTPCLDKGIVIPGSGRNKYNQLVNGDAYIEPLNNGVADFSLTQGTHEFCLMHGSAQYNVADGFSDVWFVNDAIHQEEIGTFSIPSNVSQTFFIGLETSDIYDVSDPKWWDTSWVAIIGAIIGLMLGIGLIAVGIFAKVPQAVVIGGILAMASLGFQIGNLLLGVIF